MYRLSHSMQKHKEGKPFLRWEQPTTFNTSALFLKEQMEGYQEDWWCCGTEIPSPEHGWSDSLSRASLEFEVCREPGRPPLEKVLPELNPHSWGLRMGGDLRRASHIWLDADFSLGQGTCQAFIFIIILNFYLFICYVIATPTFWFHLHGLSFSIPSPSVCVRL